MTVENVKIRVRVGASEVEVEAPISTLEKALSLVPSIVQQLPPSSEKIGHNTGGNAESSRGVPLQSDHSNKIELPEIQVKRDDSLTDVIAKIFKEQWGRRPRKLIDVRDALESYGLIYPKQSVAVALLRLAQSGTLRRFKSDGEFVYTSSTSLARETTSHESINLTVFPESQLSGSR